MGWEPHVTVAVVVERDGRFLVVSNDDDDQYLELYNQSSNAVSLADWQLTSGVSFRFSPDMVLPPDGYLVVARNAAHLRTNYANLNILNCLGDFSGKISGGGERIVLTMPDTVASTNANGKVVTNLIHIAMDEVTYRAGGQWGKWSDGGGSSLELIDPRANGRLASNWADSEESTKAPWTLIETTGVVDLGSYARFFNVLLIAITGLTLLFVRHYASVRGFAGDEFYGLLLLAASAEAGLVLDTVAVTGTPAPDTSANFSSFFSTTITPAGQIVSIAWLLPYWCRAVA